MRRIHALLFVIEGKAIDEVATMLNLGAQTVRDYVNAFLWQCREVWRIRNQRGDRRRLTKTQRASWRR